MWKPSWFKIVAAYLILSLVTIYGPTQLGVALLILASIGLIGAWVNRYNPDYEREFLLTEIVEDPEELLSSGYECWTNVLPKPRYMADPRSGKIIRDLKAEGYAVKLCPKAKDKSGKLITDEVIYSLWRKPQAL